MCFFGFIENQTFLENSEPQDVEDLDLASFCGEIFWLRNLEESFFQMALGLSSLLLLPLCEEEKGL